jgi:hypothetical protein
MKVTEFDPIETTASVRWSAEIGWLGIAQLDHAEELVVDRVRD